MDWIARHKKPLLWGLVVLLTPGVLLAIGCQSGKVWEIVDEPILSMIGVIALVMTPFTLVAMRFAEDWTERSVLFVLVFLGGGCFVLISSFGWLVFLNARLDDGGARSHHVKIVDVVRTRGTKFTVEVESWRHPGDTEEIWVPAELAKQGKRLFVMTRDGFFGFEWIAEVDGAP